MRIQLLNNAFRETNARLKNKRMLEGSIPSLAIMLKVQSRAEEPSRESHSYMRRIFSDERIQREVKESFTI